MKKTTLALLALTLTLTLGLTTNAFAWHGGGHGGYSGCSGGGWHGNGYRGAAANSNIPYDMHGGGHEYAADNSAIHEREMKNPNHRDVMDYTAPHKASPNCEGMTGPHGRHLTDK